MVKEITLKEVSRRSNLSKRTIEYYQSLGLIPPPIKRVGKRGRGVYGYYTPDITKLLDTIRDLKAHGQSLGEIKKSLDARITERFKAVLKKWGFSDYRLPELYGLPDYANTEAEMRKALPKLLSSERVEENIVAGRIKYQQFEEDLLKRLKWWDKNNEIEAWALAYISTETYSVERGLGVAGLLIIRDMKTKKDLTIKLAINELSNKIMNRAYEVRILGARVNTRLAEIIGEVEGKKKKEWQSFERSVKEVRDIYQRREKQHQKNIHMILRRRK